jgi:hypothetical protein
MRFQYVGSLKFTKQLTNFQIKNRYQELIRVNRQMRKLEVLKRFGTVYDNSKSPTSGNLTIFCPSCPQPGINLPPDWKKLEGWITRRTITVDGNFHADHIKMRRPDQDVMLTNGRGYMVDEHGYKEYLSIAKEPRVVRFDIIKIMFQSILTNPSRGHHVGITELSMRLALTIDGT